MAIHTSVQKMHPRSSQSIDPWQGWYE